MAEILLFHHALGLTPGVLGFADQLRAAGHTVHTPDLYDGKTFTAIDDGIGYVRGAGGFGTFIDLGTKAADGMQDGLVYAGFSLGVMSAQKLAQTRPGAKGALLYYSCVPPEEFGGPWPEGLPVQIHLMEEDEFVLQGDLDAARELEKSVASAELFLYPGDKHLFVDPSTTDYDVGAATTVMERTLEFLAKIG